MEAETKGVQSGTLRLSSDNTSNSKLTAWIVKTDLLPVCVRARVRACVRVCSHKQTTLPTRVAALGGPAPPPPSFASFHISAGHHVKPSV